MGERIRNAARNVANRVRSAGRNVMSRLRGGSRARRTSGS